MSASTVAVEPSQPSSRELSAVPRHAASGANMPRPDATDGPSRAALTFGLFGLVVPLLSVLAILLGSLGVGRAGRRGTRGRGLAKAGITLGVIELCFTAVVGLGAWWAWNAYGGELQRGLHGVAQISPEYAQLSASVDKAAGGDLGAAVGLARDLGPSGVTDLAGQLTSLRGLATQCQDGDRDACTELLNTLPSGLTTAK